MKISKKSQIHAQIFIYIIAIILFSFILIYGYNAIKGFKEKSEQIAYIKFKSDLSSTVDRISSDYGTLKREEFFIGGEYSKVCFVQSYEKDENYDNILNNIRNSSDYDPFIDDSFENNVVDNTFLLTTGAPEAFDVGKINVSNGYLCVDIKNGKAKIEFLGQGDHAFISSWTD